MADTFTLPDRMDLPAAKPFVNDMCQQDLSTGITLDAANVSHLGALCTQAIIGVARACNEAGGTLKLANVSEKVEAQLAVMGLTVDSIEGGMQ